jgi:hypothetical protein
LLRLTRRTTWVMQGDPCPSITMQQQIPGLLPGTGAIRLAIGDLVRSSVLVKPDEGVDQPRRLGPPEE